LSKQQNIQITQLSEAALLVSLESKINPAINANINAIRKSLEEAHLKGVHELVPSYSSLAVFYKPNEITAKNLIAEIETIIDNSLLAKEFPTKEDILTLPVCYTDEFAPDMERVMKHTGFTKEEIIKRHSEGEYRVYQLGFLPGFPFLGGMDKAISCPRKKIPALKIAGGSVGIGGAQTGIYPLQSPGGWNIIGRCPLKLFRPDNTIAPFLLSMGQLVRFKKISIDQFRVTKTSLL